MNLATPYLGVPFGFKGLRYGDNLGLKMLGQDVLNIEETQKIMQNWPGAYEAMPFSTPYFEATGGYWYVGRSIDGDSEPEFLLDTRDKMIALLKKPYILDDFGVFNVDHYNEDLLQRAVDFQDRNIEAWSSFEEQLVDRYMFVGTGKCTPSFISEHMWGDHSHFSIGMGNGDGAVPVRSGDLLYSAGSSFDVSDTAQVYYANNLFHGPPDDSVPLNTGVLRAVVSILCTDTPLIDGIKISTSLTTKARCLSVETLSPVNIYLTNSDGQHTGVLNNGQPAKLDIPDSQFYNLVNSQMVVVPDGEPYSVSLAGTGSGTIGLRLRHWEDATINRSILYLDVPVGPATQARLNYNSDADLPVLEVDEDGNSVYELTITPTIIEEPHSFDFVPPTTTIHVEGVLASNGWYTSDVTVTLLAEDNIGGMGVLKTEYSLDNGMTFKNYDGPFVISQDGVTSLVARSTDRDGNREQSSVSTVIRIDQTAPTLIISINPDVLWPANHKLVTVQVVVQAQDALDPTPVLRLVSVTSNEPDNGLGDGDTAGDIVIRSDGTILLRAERSGKGEGRVYSITYSAQDISGNMTVQSVVVTVPKNSP